MAAVLALALCTPADSLAAARNTHSPSTRKPSPATAKATRQAAGKKRPVARKAAPAPIIIPAADEHAVARDPSVVAAEFDRWLDGLAATDAVAGLAAAIVKDDRVVFERGIGVADAASGAAVTPDTVFRLASLSKAFAAAMAGMLVERGMLHWDSKVAGLLPEFTLSDGAGAQRLTVADILSHRVGLPHNTYDHLLEQAEPYQLLVGQLKDVPLACPVGACYGYQNIAFSLIGDVTYAATGDFYYHQVEKRIFHPLGMDTATFGRDALEGSPRWARPHRRQGRAWVSFVPNENYYRVAPAAGVNASIRDMEQWLIAQMGGRPDVLSPQLLRVLHTPLVETERELRSSSWRRGRLNDARYALGWRVYDYAGTTLVFHAGAVQGYRGMIAFLPRYRFGAVMLWNSESATPAGLMPMLLDRYLGLPDANWAGLELDDLSERTGGAE
ncbi:MAG: beta-lactamase family protein [Xanthomonadales bacterium]|nr:beta-lactamase family protein [Xanthomonadales bacterium]